MSRKPRVTIVLCTFNDGPYLQRCLASILSQSYRDFTLLIFDDGSTDDGPSIIRSQRDKRIVYRRREHNEGSIPSSRIAAMRFVHGLRPDYVIFTDGDCAVERTWLAAMLRALQKSGADAVEGKIVYVRDDYVPTLADRIVENKHGGLYMTANMGFRAAVLERFPFRLPYDGLEDRDLALRILQSGGTIRFAPEAVVVHQQKLWTAKSYLREARRAIAKVRIMRAHGDRWEVRFGILYLGWFALLVCPLLLLGPLLQGKIRSWRDLRLLPVAYAKAAYIRFLIWRTAMQERVRVL